MVCVEVAPRVQRGAETHANRSLFVGIINVDSEKQAGLNGANFKVIVAIDCYPSADRRVLKRAS
jgi:hypothetical protein